MKICVAGWYFHEPFLDVMNCTKHIVHMVAHRGWPKGKEVHFNFEIIPNIGLEFGCYNHYLCRVWNQGDVFFTHDDNEITHRALDMIAGLNRDQVFLFGSDEEARANGMAHGRAMFCSEKFLRKLYVDGGFWYDEGNTGQIPPTTADKPDYHNAAIQTFRAYLRMLPQSLTVNRIAIIPGLKNGYRGRV